MARMGHLLWCLLVILAACSPVEEEPAQEQSAFFVWESNRTGNWRIFIGELDGHQRRRLSPNEKKRRHCCPHISPDGSLLTYLSLEPGSEEYDLSGEQGILHLVSPDGREHRTIGPARTYAEHRAVVWHGAGSLQYIDGQGRSVLLDLDTGEKKILIPKKHPTHGWLVDPTRSWAVSGAEASFARYESDSLEITAFHRFGGCQPFLSSDGVWGYWTAGAGGPLHRIRLATGEVLAWIRKHDDLLPGDRGYAYFPMLSSSSELLILAASDDEHDHFKSDYDVLVLETNPSTLLPLGPARRLTFDPATDRYPDVYRPPLALGRYHGQAPYRLVLKAPDERAWSWDLGDGALLQGQGVDHVFVEAGHYPLLATRDDRTLKGVVVVSPRREASPLEAGMGENHPPASVAWPARRDDLLFLWETSNRPNRVPTREAGLEALVSVEASGRSRWSRDWAMDLRGGYFLADQESAARLFQGARGRNELTMEITLTPRRDDEDVRGPVVAFSGGKRSRNLVLRQVGDKLVLTIRTSLPRGARRQALEVGSVKAGESRHLILTYRPGVLRSYLDGREVSLAKVIRGDFFPWKSRPLLFGAEVNAPERWEGTLEGVAFYSRILSPEEIQEHARRYGEKLGARPEPEIRRVEGRLIARSRIPTLREISPYKDALVVFEYAVDGEAGEERIRVAHFALWNGERQPATARKNGDRYHLELEAFGSNPQIESLVLSDTLEEDYQLPFFFDSRP